VQNVKFSITTNASLISINKEAIRSLDIDYAILSFDKEHSNFITTEQFIEAMQISLELFECFELNITYKDSPHYNPIKDFLLANNIKVNFTKEISSGRSTCNENLNISAQLTTFNCPNAGNKLKNEKVTFIPKKGFTICCGPIAFDRLQEDAAVYFSTFEELNSNVLYKFLKRAESVKVITTNLGGCSSCKKALEFTNTAEIKHFNESSGWNYVLDTWESRQLEHYNKLFNPKIIKKVEVGKFRNYFGAGTNFDSDDSLVKSEGNSLSKIEIEKFSEFTIDSFYNVHTSHYSIGDIARFKNDQKVFFNLPNKYIYHEINGNLIGYLVVCKIEQHPFFKVNSWHVGYWGIIQGAQQSHRVTIKKDWACLLEKLNQETIIVANIDYFNIPADRLTDKFNFKPSCVRLDPRQ
jgi:hypothetical protein